MQQNGQNSMELNLKTKYLYEEVGNIVNQRYFQRKPRDKKKWGWIGDISFHPIQCDCEQFPWHDGKHELDIKDRMVCLVYWPHS